MDGFDILVGCMPAEFPYLILLVDVNDYEIQDEDESQCQVFLISTLSIGELISPGSRPN